MVNVRTGKVWWKGIPKVHKTNDIIDKLPKTVKLLCNRKVIVRTEKECIKTDDGFIITTSNVTCKKCGMPLPNRRTHNKDI